METISGNLAENTAYIKERLKDCNDIIMRQFYVGEKEQISVFILYTDNIVNGETIHEMILTNLMLRTESSAIQKGDVLRSLQEKAISIGEMKEITAFSDLFTAVLLGDTVILVDGCAYGLVASTKGWPSRGVPKAETEVVIEGPKDAFSESISTNIVLVRRRIRDTRMKVVRSQVGRRSKTFLALLYMEDLVRQDILKEVKKRLEHIDIDAILDAGYIEQLTERRIWSPFPQMQLTERPDKTASAILEGRIAIAIDNSPFVLLLPATLNLFFQAAEDYYERFEIMSFIRVLRYGAAFLAIALPGLYIALTAYHPSMIPTALALKMAGARTEIPFPTVMEVLIMEFSFELLREAGIRLPSPVSSTIGIVGGIIIGQAAVEAGIVSPLVVIVAALTGICTFVIPNTSFVAGIRLSKYVVIAFSAVLGLYGFWLALILLLVHLCSLKSFGIPYLYPFCSGTVTGEDDWKDTLFRAPLVLMKKRPVFTKAGHRVRQKDSQGRRQ